MTAPPRQLTLDWPHSPSFADEDFLSAPSNRAALEAIRRWPDWTSPMLLLVGPEGSGKSHLAAIWTRNATATTVRAESLDETAVKPLAESPAILIEDADRIGDREALLFHVANAALQNQSFVLLTARSAPDVWGLRTPDLVSRLRLAPLVRLDAPDAGLTEAVLFKLFSDRQLQVEPRVVAYIAQRIDRSLAAARAIVATLDREALSRGRRVTRAMASEVLRAAAEGNEPG